MPNTQSAKKSVRQTATRRARNRWRKRRIREQVTEFMNAVQADDVTTAEAEFRKTCSLLDKVATTSTLHRNAAARRKSRLSARLRDLKAKAG